MHGHVEGPFQLYSQYLLVYFSARGSIFNPFFDLELSFPDFNRLIYLLFFVSLVTASCSTGNRMSGNSKKCGCGLNKGFVGY